MMKPLVMGVVAHVDAGKTTLSEALLYQAGARSTLGRVDNGDAFLDTDALERQRGITIYSHQAQFQTDTRMVTLVDTPGHVDFAAQMEQTLSILDVAVLVVSATEGIQGSTRTLWRLLDRYQVPTMIFVNKLDAPTADRDQVLTALQTEFSPGILPFDGGLSAVAEEVALQDDQVLETFLETGTVTATVARQMIANRQLFPAYFGAALKLTGVAALLKGLDQWAPDQPDGHGAFGGRVFKISHDDRGERLTWLRVMTGELAVKDQLLPDQKINQLRLYDGPTYHTSDRVMAGTIVAIPDLTGTTPGQGLGQAAPGPRPLIQPVLTYQVHATGVDDQTLLAAVQQLADEDPQLQVDWSSQLQELRVQLMGPIQLEVLQERLASDFGLSVTFDAGSILYQETITRSVEGVGHFEPLRHYAEVHLRLDPGPRGSGVTIASDCDVDVLGKNWQHQVLTSLTAKTHLGVLIGAPLTDVKITLISGRASNVHSVGGDFREATWRAVRQGLMMARASDDCQLLEPWYHFRLTVPADQIGRAMTDVQRLAGTFAPPETVGDQAVLTGTAPVATMQDYGREVQAYTHGTGALECLVSGYQPAHDAAAIVAASAYQPKADIENTPDSVFCAHGAGYPVNWDEVPHMAHVAYAAD